MGGKLGVAGEAVDTRPLKYLRETGGDALIAELMPARNVFRVPYSSEDGRLLPKQQQQQQQLMALDLRPGARVRLTSGPGEGFEGVMDQHRSSEGHWRVQLPCQREGSPDHGKGVC